MARGAGKAVSNYAKEVPGDARRAMTMGKNIKTMVNVNGVGGTAKAFAKNKAVQVGAGGLAAAGAAGAAMSGKKKKNDQD